MKKHIISYRMATLDGGEIAYKPFSRRDFKDLSTAATISSGDTLYNSIAAFIQTCIIGNERVEDIPYWDAAMLFVRSRSVSVSEVVELKYECKHVIKTENSPDRVCGSTILAGLLLPNVFYTNTAGMINEIHITENIVLKMRYPNIVEYLKAVYESGINGFDNDEVISNMVIAVYNENDYDDAENNENFKDEVKEMISQLPPNLYQKIMNWFANLPNIGCDIPIKCNSCGAKDTDKLRGLIDFFV
jgi:hypothetical protein